MKQIELIQNPENGSNPEPSSNVLEFSKTLSELRKNVDPNLVKKREAWRDSSGKVRMVDYVEWHTVADILDGIAPNWAHAVKNIRQIGELITVTVAITIDGVTREGIGTGPAQSERGIKKAEHDALKRAAVKFGIARDLYKREFDVIENKIPEQAAGGFPSNPLAQTLSDMVTTKQLGMIWSLARRLKLDANDECLSLMNCKPGELSRRAASALIDHLQEMGKDADAVRVPLRKAS